MGFSLGDALSLAGTAVTAFNVFDAGEENADASREQAVRVRQKTTLEVARTRRLARRVKGAQRAGFGRAGVRSGAGSALDVIADSAAEAALDIKLLELGGSVEENLRLSEARDASRRGAAVAGGGLLADLGELFEDF